MERIDNKMLSGLIRHQKRTIAKSGDMEAWSGLPLSPDPSRLTPYPLRQLGGLNS